MPQAEGPPPSGRCRGEGPAVVMMSEELLDAPVRTPERLRQVNAVCRLVEMVTVAG